MKSLFIIFYLSINAFSILSAQWQVQNYNTNNIDITDIDIIDSLNSYATGTFGTIYKTSNAGKDWFLLPNSLVESFHAISAPTVNTIYVSRQFIYKSDDAGRNWVNIGHPKADVEGSLFDLYFFNNDTGIVAWAHVIYRTIDGGASWDSVHVSPVPELFSTGFTYKEFVFTSQSNGYVFGDTRGTIREISRTKDMGLSWDTVSIELSRENELIASLSTSFVNDTVGYYLSQDQRVFKTSDGAKTWSANSTPSSDFYWSLDFINETEGWIVGDKGKIYKTENAASSWSKWPEYSDTSDDIFGVKFRNNKEAWAYGRNNLILKYEPDTIAPSIPRTVIAIPGDKRVFLVWERLTDKDLAYYTIYRNTIDDIFLADSIYSLNAGERELYMDAGLDNHTTYYYWLTASDRVENTSLPSEPIMTVPAEGLPGPEAPDKVVTDLNLDFVELSWTAKKDIPMVFQIFRGTADDSLTATMINSTSEHRYKDFTFIKNTKNYYWIRSLDLAGNLGPFSEAVEVSLVGEKLYGVSNTNNLLYSINTKNGLSTTKLITSSGESVEYFTALASHSQTESLWAIGVAAGFGGFYNYLYQIDVFSGQAVNYGNLQKSFSGLSFDQNGTLYGITDEDANMAKSLYLINTDNADTRLIMSLNNNDHGDALAFNLNSNQLFHISGGGEYPLVFERVDTLSKSTSQINISGDIEPTNAFKILSLSYWQEKDLFLLTDENMDLYSLTEFGKTKHIGKLEGKLSGLAFIHLIKPPESPKNLMITNLDNSLGLSWSTNEEQNISQYRIYRDKNSNPFMLLDTVQAELTDYIDSKTENDSTYYYRITAVNEDKLESDFSNLVNAKSMNLAPQTPKLLGLEFDDQQVKLNWQANSEKDFLKYLFYSDTNPNPVVLVDSLFDNQATTLTIKGLINSKKYYFRMTVVDSGYKESPYSETKSATPKAPLLATLNIGQNQVLPQYISIHLQTNIPILKPDSAFLTYESQSLSLDFSPISNENSFHVGHKLTGSGQYDFYVKIKAKNSSRYELRKTYQIEHVKKDKTVVLFSPDQESHITIEKNSLQAGRYLFSSAGNQRNYEYGASGQLATAAKITIQFNSKLRQTGKYFIYLYQEGSWKKLNTQIYQLDKNKNEAVSFTHKLGLFKVDYDNSFGGNNLVPSHHSLHDNFPNPFNPSTTIQYDLAQNTFVNISIYNLLGQQVRSLVDEFQQAETRKSIIWDGRDNKGNPVASGVYIYRIIAGDFVRTKRMLLLK